MNRKFLTLLLAVILLISTITTVNAINSYAYTVSTNKGIYAVGDLVYITVQVTNNSVPYVGTPVTIKVTDSTNSSVIFTDQQVTKSQGISVSTFRLDSNIALETYTVTVNAVGSYKTTTFTVVEAGGIIPPPDPVYPTVPSGDTTTQPPISDPDDVTAPSPILDSTTGIAATSIPENVLTTAISNTPDNSNGQRVINIEVPVISGANGYSVSLPSSLLTSNDIQANTLFQITTGTATMVVPSNMLTPDLIENQNIVQLSINKIDASTLPPAVSARVGNHAVVDVSLLVNGQAVEWNNPDASVQVSIAYVPTPAELANPDNIIVWYIDNSGNIHTVSNSRYDAEKGMLVFQTNHFSKYAVAYVSSNIEDITALPWANKQIDAIVARDILKVKSVNKFDPKADITRGDFIYGLVKALNLSTKFDENFADVNAADYYYNELGIAKKLGISNGVGDNKYNPNGTISRQDMMTLIARALKLTNKLDTTTVDESKLSKFEDHSKIASYAKDAVALVVAEGIIQGDGKNIEPQNKTSRAQAAVVLYRIFNK